MGFCRIGGAGGRYRCNAVLEDQGLDAIRILQQQREGIVLPDRAGQADAIDQEHGNGLAQISGQERGLNRVGVPLLLPLSPLPRHLL